MPVWVFPACTSCQGGLVLRRCTDPERSCLDNSGLFSDVWDGVTAGEQRHKSAVKNPRRAYLFTATTHGTVCNIYILRWSCSFGREAHWGQIHWYIISLSFSSFNPSVCHNKLIQSLFMDRWRVLVSYSRILLILRKQSVCTARPHHGRSVLYISSHADGCWKDGYTSQYIKLNSNFNCPLL